MRSSDANGTWSRDKNSIAKPRERKRSMRAETFRSADWLDKVQLLGSRESHFASPCTN